MAVSFKLVSHKLLNLISKLNFKGNGCGFFIPGSSQQPLLPLNIRGIYSQIEKELISLSVELKQKEDEGNTSIWIFVDAIMSKYG